MTKDPDPDPGDQKRPDSTDPDPLTVEYTYSKPMAKSASVLMTATLWRKENLGYTEFKETL